MSQFTTRRLSASRVLVKGTDVDGTEGSTVLNGAEWDAIKAHQDFSHAEENFNAEVENFFKPLFEAAEKLQETSAKPVDPASVVVLKEGTEGVEGEESQVIELGHDSIVLRLIEEGTFDRLLWVGGNIEVLEPEPEPEPEPAPVSFPEDVWVDRSGETSSHAG